MSALIFLRFLQTKLRLLQKRIRGLNAKLIKGSLRHISLIPLILVLHTHKYVLRSMYSTNNFCYNFCITTMYMKVQFGTQYSMYSTYYVADTICVFIALRLSIEHDSRYVTILLLANLRVLKLFSLFTDDESISVLLHVSSHHERQNPKSK